MDNIINDQRYHGKVTATALSFSYSGSEIYASCVHPHNPTVLFASSSKITELDCNTHATVSTLPLPLSDDVSSTSQPAKFLIPERLLVSELSNGALLLIGVGYKRSGSGS